MIYNVFMLVLKLGTALFSCVKSLVPPAEFQFISLLYAFVRLTSAIESISLIALSRQGVLDYQFWWAAIAYPEMFHGNIISLKRRLLYVFYLLISLVGILYYITSKMAAVPPCYGGNFTSFSHTSSCYLPYFLITFTAIRMIQNYLTLIYIYMNAAIFAAQFERLCHKMASEPSLHNNSSSIYQYRKQYGYLSKCVSAFNDKIGIHIAMALLSLMFQVMVMSIYAKNNLQDYSLVAPILLLSSLGFALLMLGAICLAEVVSNYSIQ